MEFSPERSRGAGVSYKLVALASVTIAALATLATSSLLYQVQIAGVKERLAEALQTQIRIVESVARSYASDDGHGALVDERGNLRRWIVEAYRNNRGFGETSEFVLGRREGDQIVFLLEQRFADQVVPDPIPLEDDGESLAAPMRLALEGKSGTLIGKDYRGVEVIAAYSQISGLGLGIVAKLDKAEVMGPFVRTTAIVGGLLVLSVLAVVGMVFFLVERLWRRLDQSERERLVHLNLIEDQQRALDIHAIVSVTDRKGVIRYANDHFCSLSGYARQEVIGKTHALVKSGQHGPDFYQLIWDNLKRGEPWRGEIKNRSKSGVYFWVDTTIVPFRGSDGKTDQYIAIQSDITQRKQYEEELIRAREDAEKANEAKSLFLANMSHEIRTPMNAIIGYAEILRTMEQGEEQRRYLRAIRQSGDFLLETINGILDLSRIEAGEEHVLLEDVDLGSLLNEVCGMLGNQAESKGIELGWEQDNETRSAIRTDSGMLKHILVNIVSNAIKFTDRGSVRVKAIGGMNGKGDKVISIIISDTGVGIAAEKLGSIFENFVQAESDTTRRYGGTGLGLPIAKGLARLLGGDVSVRSRLGRGSEFEVEIPFIRGVMVSEPSEARKPLVRGDGMKGRVLVVEDNRANQEVALRMLKRLGLEADVVDNGLQAVKLANEKGYDLILMDCQMPEMDGYEATRTIRKEEDLAGRDHIPIIAMTARAMKGDRERCLSARMDDYLAKPISMETLGEVLSRRLGGPFGPMDS